MAKIRKKTMAASKTTYADVLTSKTEAEFLQKREQLIEALNEEMTKKHEELDTKLKAAEQAEVKISEINDRINGYRAEEKSAKEKLSAINAEYEKALGVIENAEREAAEIIQRADEQGMDKLAEASEKANEVWRGRTEEIERQIGEIAEREAQLAEKRRTLQRERDEFEIEKSVLEEEREYVGILHKRYESCSPAKLQALETELCDLKSRYDMQVARNKQLSGKVNDLTVLIDSIRSEVSDENGSGTVSLGGLVNELREYREKHDRLAAVYSRYPDEESISALERKASRASELELRRDELENECDLLRREIAAARRSMRELDAVRCETESLKALNEHLLKEIASHKSALESRTGDNCPGLTRVDNEVRSESFMRDISERSSRTRITSLARLADHVRDYAGSRPESDRLYYTADDIRAFIAGMAVSRLMILQGMSGTGKSSLPRIFAEAISGFDRLIPVAPSWRDKNELLGFYDSFDKQFRTTTFTIELYRSGKKACRNIPSFMVLDEMNLARIEYYFTDFLSVLQEPDKNRWLIELTPFDMRTLPLTLPDSVTERMRTEAPDLLSIWERTGMARSGSIGVLITDSEKESLASYLSKLQLLTGAEELIDGRSIRVTDNIWFIGTANRDESTFEISDKVYDRAQVISFDRRGLPDKRYEACRQMYLPADNLLRMFSEAISGFSGAGRVEEYMNKTDKALERLFGVQLGNRLFSQVSDFAAVFTAAGGTVEGAVDRQIATKVLRKVLQSDDAEAFIELSDELNGFPMSKRLTEKRIKELE